MRILIVLCLVLATAAGCGKKKPAQSPANAEPAAESAGGMQEKSSPADADDAKKKDSADPCEGGEYK